MKFLLTQSLKPGQITCVSVNGKQILLANVNGQYHATDAMCTHEDWPLCNGALKDATIECPLHGSRFSLIDGKPLDDPATIPLKVYQVNVLDNEIEIKIE